MRKEYQFFHWHLEFPEVFRVPNDPSEAEHPEVGWSGGFSCVLGNPPWDRVKLQEPEFFAPRHEGIAKAPNKATRQRMIEALKDEDPRLFAKFEAAKRRSQDVSCLLRNSGRYPLCGCGDVNTYSVYAENDHSLVGARGRVGIIVPTGIVTDFPTRAFFRRLVEQESVVAVYDFHNNDKLFRDVGNRTFKFCILITQRTRVVSPSQFAFFLRDPVQVKDPERRYGMTAKEILSVNPNTGTCPVFRTRRDVDLTLGVHKRVPVLVDRRGSGRNLWDVSFLQMLHMSDSSKFFELAADLKAEGWMLSGNHFTKRDSDHLPLYEGKIFHQFDHRYGDFSRQPAGSQDSELPRIPAEVVDDPDFVPLPRYWVAEDVVTERLSARWNAPWFLGFRDFAKPQNERTAIMSTLPHVAAGNTVSFLLANVDASQAACLLATFNSFVNDYCLRQKLGGTHLTYFYVEQMPIPPPSSFDEATWYTGDESLEQWIGRRVLELVYTAKDMRPFAEDLGFVGEPFRWNEDRRTTLRAELDAAMFHLYGIERPDVEYIFGTFPIVERNDIARYGEYRTKRLILDAYGHMAEAVSAGTPYRSMLDPPPGQGPRHPAATTPQ